MPALPKHIQTTANSRVVGIETTAPSSEWIIPSNEGASTFITSIKSDQPVIIEIESWIFHRIQVPKTMLSASGNNIALPICIAPDDEYTIKVWRQSNSSQPANITITMNSTEWFQLPIDNANVTDYLDAVGHKASVFVKPEGHRWYSSRLV